MSSTQPTPTDRLVSFFRSMPPGLRFSLIMIILGYGGMTAFTLLGLLFGSYLCIGLANYIGLIGHFGLFCLFIWLFHHFIFPIVRKEQVVERWALLIRDGHEHAPEIVQTIRTLILDSKAPNITMEQKEVAPSIVRGVLGKRRSFLVISNTTNGNLRRYEMYLSARDYGNNLQVCWYVILRRRLGEILLRILLFVPFLNLIILPIYILAYLPKAGEAGLINLDFFDLQDLTAYVTNAHHCVLDAVDALLLELSQDSSKIERKSQGFLGIS